MIKLCVPVTGTNMEEIKSQLIELSFLDFDMIEWRADYYFSMEGLALIKDSFPTKELIFTIRTVAEGGECTADDDGLLFLYNLVALSGKIDILDLELEGICKTNPEIVGKMKQAGMKILISNHDFEKTPGKQEIIDRYKRMEILGGDIGKIAVMPKDLDDVEKLMNGAKEARSQLEMPIIAISMGELGKKTRIDGEEFGSIITFGSLNKPSAPGQIGARELKQKLEARGELVY